ncbi:MAG: C-terminal binding protein [Anaerolineae bacterium]
MAGYIIVGTNDNFDDRLERQILESAGHTFHYRPCLTPAELAEASRDADVVLMDVVPLPGSVLRQRPRLKLIVLYSTGFDQVDLGTATELGILVCNAGEYCTREVADHTWMLILALWRRLIPFRRRVQQGAWRYDVAGPIRSLEGAVLGIIGAGRIGTEVARRAPAFGMQVIGYDPLVPPEQMRQRGIEPVGLAELLTRSDLISLHLPSQKDKKPVLDRQAFAQLKPGVFLINVSRADLIDLSAVREALETERVAGLALDVWTSEPPESVDPLFEHPRVLVTPHVGWYSTASAERVRRRVAEETVRILSGLPPQYAVNHPPLPRLRVSNKVHPSESN